MFQKITHDAKRLNELISLGALDAVKCLKKLTYVDTILSDYDRLVIALEKWPEIFLDFNDVLMVQRYLENRHKRNKRLRNRIEKLLCSDSPIFGTLTFSDKTLNSTTQEQRRLLVVRYLKSCNCSYVANIDYGKRNEREHYHFIADKRINPKGWLNNGALKLLKIKSNSSALRLARYLNKLYNHAIKDTTKNQKIIYSRKS